MLPNKVLGKYDWNVNGKTGVGAAWVVAAFVLPMLVWAVFMLARMSGLVTPTKANPTWALVWQQSAGKAGKTAAIPTPKSDLPWSAQPSRTSAPS